MFTYGSVRGAPGNGRPYRVTRLKNVVGLICMGSWGTGQPTEKTAEG
jgi:hypothetical protein